MALDAKTRPVMAGQIIVLNGTSSSGKTSIVHALQDVLAEPYLDVGLDKFIWMLPKRYLVPPLWQEVLGLATEAGPVGQRLISGIHQAVATLSKAGNHVIVDHVLLERPWVTECAHLFSELPALFVGVHCPLHISEQREIARKDRTLGQARAQFPLVHAHTIYDLELNTAAYDAVACARRIKQHLEAGHPREAFKRLRQRELA